MGLLRLILALAVVLGHTAYDGQRLMAASDAVHVFFVISGFYMCMVIRRRYGCAATGLRAFYLNRVLRLYPTFFFTVCASIFWYVLCQWRTGGAGKQAVIFQISEWLPTWGWIMVWLPNFTILGVDLPAWFNAQAGQGVALAGFASGPVSGDEKSWLGYSLWVPQSWTIGCEIWFYALAPMVLVRLAWLRIASAGAISAGLLVFCSQYFLYGGYFIWLFWFWLFALGMLGFLVYEKIEFKLEALFGRYPVYSWLIAVFCWAGFTVPFLLGWSISSWVIIAVTVPFIPLLFHITKSNKLDRILGEFSYPVYCTHMLAGEFNQTLIGALKWDWSYLVIMNLVTTMVISGFCVFVIEQPIERMRAKIASRIKN